MVAMVCNLAEKVDEYPLNPGSLSIGYVPIGTAKKTLYSVAGCLLFRGCLSIEVNGRIV